MIRSCVETRARASDIVGSWSFERMDCITFGRNEIPSLAVARQAILRIAVPWSTEASSHLPRPSHLLVWVFGGD